MKLDAEVGMAMDVLVVALDGSIQETDMYALRHWPAIRVASDFRYPRLVDYLGDVRTVNKAKIQAFGIWQNWCTKPWNAPGSLDDVGWRRGEQC